MITEQSEEEARARRGDRPVHITLRIERRLRHNNKKIDVKPRVERGRSCCSWLLLLL